ncbi:MAG: peptidoglycan DD-metalloendopeptidase family protein [Clostridia bacterium]|nr:peptidoglycan DD-metalloendopeptidase family protein [Clostridia bacterium]MBR2418814.1 peptidoglycan DD-metalloendopeptidase family protein [Clostridia bacterium]
MKRFTAALLCAVLVFSAVVYTADFNIAEALTQQELQEKSDKIDAEIKANQKKLNEIKNNKKAQQEYLDTLESQIKALKSKVDNIQTQMNTVETEITNYTVQINQLNKEIKQTNKQIKEAEKQIDEIEKDIDSKADSLSKKLRSNYVNGTESPLKILMGADSLASFLTRLEMMKRISESEKKTITEFKEKMETLQSTRDLLEKDKKELKEKKTELSSSKKAKEEKQSDYKDKMSQQEKVLKDLEKQQNDVEKLISSLDNSSKVYQNYISNLESEKKAADAEINQILSEYYANQNGGTTKPTLPAQNANPVTKPDTNGSYNSGDSWAWPLGSAACYISSPFGNRDASVSGWSFHGGVDIAGGSGKLHGKPVYATRGGTVITAVTSDSGYGIYVLIDHGGGYSSLYAHMSVRYVNVGDTVQKGQMIGRVGNTGNSRGAHLHFEIRYYGEKQDPMKYVKKP